MNLDDLRNLEKKATPGPWENSTGFVRARVPVTGTLGDGIKVTLSCTWVAETVRGEGYVPGNGNADFIAALRNAAPALLACAEALRDISTADICGVCESGFTAGFVAREALRRLEEVK